MYSPLDRLSIRWCRTFHARVSWPLHGRYHCLSCFRECPVPWSEGEHLLRQETPQPATRHPALTLLNLERSHG